MNQKQIMKRYFKEFGIAMAAYIFVLIASVTVLNNIELPQAAKIVVVLLPVIPIIFVVIAIMRVLRDSDELVQRVQSNAVMFSAVATGLITFSYGFLEGIGFPEFPTVLVLPMMFALWGLGFGYFNRRYQ